MSCGGLYQSQIPRHRRCAFPGVQPPPSGGHSAPPGFSLFHSPSFQSGGAKVQGGEGNLQVSQPSDCPLSFAQLHTKAFL